MTSSTFARQIILGLAVTVAFMLGAAPAQSQATNQYDKGTPPQFAAGVSSFGSYTSADLGTVNLSNGALNLKIPLVNIGGRGMSLPITLNWSSKIWSASIDYDQERGCGRGGDCDSGQPSMVPLAYADYANADSYMGYEWRAEAGWTVGGLPFMIQRIVRINYTDIQPRGPCYDFTLPKLTFTLPDRGEIEFRDDVYDGAPLPSDCSGWQSGYSRGRRWHATDGSGAIYISDVDNGASWRFANLSGVVITADGTRFYLNAGGGCYSIVDSNGNKITVTENGIVDPLGRTTTIQSNVPNPDNPSETLAVLVTVTGYGGQPRYYKVRSGTMNEHYRSDINPGLPVITGSYDPMSWGYSDWWPTTATKLFPLSYGLFVQRIDDRPVIYELVLPDQRSLRFNYNQFGEVAEVQMPTGGKVWYDYGSRHSLPTGTSPTWETTGDYHTSVWQVDRAVIQRRTFPDGNTLEGTWNYGFGDSSSTVTASAPDGTLLLNQAHLFLPDGRYTESPYGGATHTGTNYTLWSTGIEWRTETRDANGVILSATEQDWTQRVPVSWPVYQQEQPANDNRVNQTRRYLDDGSIARTDTVYDNFNYPRANNVAEVWEYDFDQSLKRRTTTAYVTGAYQNDDSIHLLSLPLTQTVWENGNQVAQTTNEYDNYAGDGNHAPLADYGAVVGHDNNYNALRITRGNLTASGHWLNTTNSNIYSYTHYDILGNVVGTKDARGHVTTISFADDYGDGSNPGGGVQGTFGATYALPTLITSPPPNPGQQPQTARSQYDFVTGLLTGFRDRNGFVTQTLYNDPFNRPTLVKSALGIAGVESHGAMYYAPGTTPYGINLANNDVLTANDQNTPGDGALRSWTRTDGFGRTVESWSRDPQGDVKVHTIYDGLGRAARSSNPYRPSQGEVAFYTTTVFDLMGRVTSVTTPDAAVISTSYAVNSVTVIDQAGKQRRSMTDALGRLIRVDEPDKDTNALGTTSSPIQPTCYEYDALANLTKVIQGTQLDPGTGRCALAGSQQRTFTYNSLSRLLTATNPESSTVGYQYDNNGNVTQKTDARGVVSTYVYDALNRNTSITYSDGTPSLGRAYDGATNGKGRFWYNWTSAADTSKNTHTAIDLYDAFGRVKNWRQHFWVNGNWTQPPYAMAASYDLAGQMTTMTYPSGRIITNTFDDAGRLNSFTGNLGDGTQRTYATGISYSSFGGMKWEQYGTATPLYHKNFYNIRGQMFDTRVSSVNDTWDWNRGRLILYYSSNHQWGGSGTDNNGNVRFSEHWIPPPNATLDQAQYLIEQTYNYDSLNRLSSVSESTLDIAGGGNWTPRYAQAYSYDRHGNRTINTSGTWGAGINNAAFELDPLNNNRLLAPGDSVLAETARRMQYDPAGNLKFDNYTGQGARTYDAENRMTGAQSSPASYVYDADGHRVKRIVGSNETWQIYGLGGELLAEYTSNGTQLSKEYGYRNGELLITATVTAGSGGSAFSFTDDPLVAETTTVRAAHVAELRTAVNQARARANLSSATWTDDPVQPTVTAIKAVHITELRARLDEARAALGLSAANYTDPTLISGYQIKAAHVQELRAKTNEALTTGAGTSLDIRWLVADHLGTPRMIFNQTGSLAGVSRHDYLPFGEELFAGTGGRTTAQGYPAIVGNNVRQKFTAKERDNETGLDYFLARYYSSTQGRFTSPDEFTGGPDELFDFAETASANPTFYAELDNPQSLNKYQYTYNNPINMTDPDGHCPPCAAIAEIVLTGADVVITVKTWRDPNASRTEKVATTVGTIAGALLPGGGYGIAAKLGVKALKREAVQQAVTKADDVGDAAKSLSKTENAPTIPAEQRAKPPTRKQREDVYNQNKQKNDGKLKCEMCGTQMERAKKDRRGVPPKPNSASVDHIKPRSRGGTNDPSNLRGACRKCNRDKSDQ